MTNILKFQTREEKAKAERIGVIAQIRTTMLEDGSIWYKIGTHQHGELTRAVNTW